jgi:hypothetical protein
MFGQSITNEGGCYIGRGITRMSVALGVPLA